MKNILLVLIIGLSAYSMECLSQEQTVNELDSISMERQSISIDTPVTMPNTTPLYSPPNRAETPSSINLPEDIVDPDYANTISEMKNETYDIQGQYRALDQVDLLAQHKKDVFLGLGQFHQLALGVRWISNERLSFFSQGLFIQEMSHHSGKIFMRWGISTGFTYSVTPKLSLGGEAVYLSSKAEDPFKGELFFPQSNVGVSLMYQMKPNVKVGVGTRYQEFKSGMNGLTTGTVKVGF